MEYVTTACCFLPRAVKQPTHFCWIMSSFATSRPPPYRCLNGSFLGFPQRALRLQNFAIQHSYSNYGRMKTLRAVTPVGLSTESMSEKRAQEEPSAVLSGDRCSEPLAIVLDIEGTTTPISFVMDVLFPYARDNVRSHLELTYDSEETQDDINLLRKQAEEDVEAGVIGVQSIPPSNASKNEIIAAAEANVISMIKADCKVTALKELQGHIWRSGFMKGEIKGQVFDDVPKALSKWQSAGQKAYIYSSGSREAQRLIFGNTQYGDLRPFLCGYFDTYIGNKREVRSYKEIFLSLGVDKPSQIVFATDVLQEAIAAKQAGLKAVLVLRPGNAPLPEEHGFETVTDLLQI